MLVVTAVMLVGATQSPAGTTRATVDLEATVNGPQLMPLGVNTTYKILVANRGPNTARGVHLLVWLPKDAYLIHAQGHCRRLDDQLDCRIGSLGLAKFKWIPLEFIARDVGVAALRVHVVAKGLEPNIDDNFDTFRIAYQPDPAKADIGVSITPSGIPEWFQPDHPIPDARGFTVTVTNRGPGDAVRVLLHYGIEGLSPIAWSGPPVYPNSWPLEPWSTTCNWATLGGEVEPPPTIYGAAMNFCIFRLSGGETQTYEVYTRGTPGGAWSVQADPITPDPNPSDNTAQATF